MMLVRESWWGCRLVSRLPSALIWERRLQIFGSLAWWMNPICLRFSRRTKASMAGELGMLEDIGSGVEGRGRVLVGNALVMGR